MSVSVELNVEIYTQLYKQKDNCFVASNNWVAAGKNSICPKMLI
jgi:hypothetical protein